MKNNKRHINERNKKFEEDSKGHASPTDTCRYLASDGLYYSGLCGSPDWGKEEFKDLAAKILLQDECGGL